MRALLAVLATAVLSSPAAADTVIAGGNLPGASNTWTLAGSPYILQGDVTIPAGATLTIDAGVEVRAQASSDAQGAGVHMTRVELIVDGSLDVNGTTASPVTFRSTSTSSGTWYGIIATANATAVSLENATIEDGIIGLTALSPGAVITTSRLTIDSASSYGMHLRAGTPTLDRVYVSSAGSYGVFVGESASPTLTNCIVRNSASYGVYIAHSSAGRSVTLDNCTLNANGIYNVLTNASSGFQATVTITDSIITNANHGVYRSDAATVSVTNTNVWNNSSGDYSSVTPGAGTFSANPLYVSSTDLRLTSNSPSRFGATGNVDQGALPYDVVPTPGLYGTLWSNTTLTLAQSPYTLAGDLTVPANVTLTIEPGVTLQYQASSDIMRTGNHLTRGELVVRGRIVADATSIAPITLTSTSASSGTWYGVDFEASAQDSVLDHVHINRATIGLTYRSTGSGNVLTNVTAEGASSYGLHVRTGSQAFDGWRSISAGSYGVFIGESASPTFTNCVVRNSASYGVYIAHSSAGRSVMLDNCTLNANGIYNVLTNASSGFQATVTITDSIITNANHGVYRSDAATVSVTNTNVWNNSSGDYSSVTPGAGTISANPLYASSTDLRLTSNSPSRFGATGSVDQGALPYDVVPTPGLYGTLWSNTTLAAAQSPYTLAGDLTISPNVTLTIEPGVTLQFQASSDIMRAGTHLTRGELIVRGRILADGTTLAPITFTSTSASSGTWYGVDFDASARDSVLDRVAINRATIGLTYRSTGAGNAITNVTAEGASSYGLHVRTGNLNFDGWRSISAGSYGVFVGESASPAFTNCVVRNSASYGVYIAHSSAGRSVSLMNCTLNANGIYNVLTNASSGFQATVTITNSIITNANHGVYRSDAATVAVTYSDVWNNSSGNYSSVTPGIGTISANPQYVSTTDLHLQSTSVAIDSGTTGPNHDADGISRPLDGNAIGGAQYDMGAYEFVLMAQCGNGSVETGETCDSGTNNGMYGYCKADCSGLGPRCGDSMVNGTEQCDDGNSSNTDACLNTCMNAACGDTYVRAGVEQCDDGNTSNTDGCVGACVLATCGDTYVRTGVEECDDGNGNNTDACLATCVEATCGDGYVEAGVEDCDDDNVSNTDACTNACEDARCGDGHIRAGMEECDDGNTVATDACTATCNNAACGDSVVQAGVEDCDDGNAVNTDACVEGCVAAACGDGYVHDGEEGCDDGNTSSADDCSSTCVSTTCGDGIVQSATEECDDGNTEDTDACRYNCIDAACGDGVVRDGVEDCDDGNVMAGDGCSPACDVETDVEPPPGMPDAGGGCCQTDRGSGGAFVLALVVGVCLRRRRRR